MVQAAPSLSVVWLMYLSQKRLLTAPTSLKGLAAVVVCTVLRSSQGLLTAPASLSGLASALVCTWLRDC